MNQFLDWLGLARAERPAAPATKSAAYPLIAFHGPGEPYWPSASGSALVREGFMRNPVVHRCVRMIAEAAASLPLLLYEGSDELDSHPLLALLTRPNPRQAGTEFMEALYCQLLVSGNAYVEGIAAGGPVRELHLLRPGTVFAMTDEEGWPAAYEHRSRNRRRRIEAGPGAPGLLHLAQYNPASDFEGLPPLAAAHMALDIHNAASRWNKALLDNSARPSGALVYLQADGANLTADQFDRLKRELEDGYSGSARAGRPMLLEGGLDWKPMGYSPRDMDFAEARNGAARDIALAFGVPPMLLGIPGDNTYSNYQEANRVFWRQSVLPLASRVIAALGAWLTQGTGGSIRLDFDRDAVEALNPDREALWKRVGEAGFLTRDEQREAVGYGPLDEGSNSKGEE
jgi:HK97 family phage portal protein